MRRARLAMVAAVLVLLPSVAAADYIYTISYSALNGFAFGESVYSFPADSFSFTVPDIITGSASQIVSTPGAELNGFSFSSIETNTLFGRRDFEVGPNFDAGALGDVVALFFATDGLASAPGIYPSALAGRGIFIFSDDRGVRAATYAYGPGTLEIAEAGATIPEPASILLLATGLVGLRAWRRLRGYARTASRQSPPPESLVVGGLPIGARGQFSSVDIEQPCVAYGPMIGLGRQP